MLIPTSKAAIVCTAVCMVFVGLGKAEAQSPPSSDGVAPMLTITGRTPTADREIIVIDRTAEAQCGGQAITPVRREDLAPRVFSEMGPLPGQTPRPESRPIADEVFPFAIDGQGRPISIKRSVRSDDVIIVSNTSDWDVQASLASWRFEARARSDCRLTVTSRRLLAEEAPAPLLARALALGGESSLVPALRSVLSREGDNCASGLPPVRTAAIPNRRRGLTARGGRDWAAVRFDIEADGTTTNVERLTSSGDQVWDDEAVRSVRETNFAPEERRGCLVSFQRVGEDLPAPSEPPDVQNLDRCSTEQRARLVTDNLDYPAPFSRRGVEGWAVIRFSLASWGAVGDVEVIEAQPASAFGEAATRLIRQSSVAAGPDHVVGCVDRVIFRMPMEGERPNVVQ